MSPRKRRQTVKASGKVIYTARTRTTGGREDGAARSCDGRLDIMLSLPGAPRIGTNPEQLFAAAWSASFASAIGVAARTRNLRLPEIRIDAEIDLHLADGAHSVSARFNVCLPGLDRDIAASLIEEAGQFCPYSRVTRGNIDAVFALA